KVAKTNLTVEDLESFDKQVAKKSMGQLLREIQKYVKTDSAKVDQCFEQALRDRNFLMHRYFREREQGFNKKATRFKMMRELVQIGNVQEQAATLMRAMRIAFSNALEKKANPRHGKDKAVF